METISTISQKLVYRYAILLFGIDYVAGEHHRFGCYAIADRPCGVPCVGEAPRNLQNARIGLGNPLLLQPRLDLRPAQCDRDEGVVEGLAGKQIAVRD